MAAHEQRQSGFDVGRTNYHLFEKEKIMIQVKLLQLPHSKDLPLPEYATSHSAGVDLMAAINGDVTLHPMQRQLIATGIAIALPDGYEAQIRPRSGLALKH